jgi:hypothetical protein
MKLRNIIPISLIVIFVTGLAFSGYGYHPVIHGQTRWERVYHPATESERYVVTEVEEKTGLIAGVFSAANWMVSGTLDMAGSTYDGTEKLTKDVLTSAGDTVDATLDTSKSMVDGTMQFTDDTVRGTTGAVMGSEK